MERSLRILVADDNALVMLTVADLLDDAGFISEGACDGAGAIARLTAAGEAIDALVTDIQMGTGPDGWMVARHARALKPHLPVIYMTGASHPDMSLAVPGALMLAKPIRRGTLMAALDRLLPDRASAHSNRQASGT